MCHDGAGRSNGSKYRRYRNEKAERRIKRNIGVSKNQLYIECFCAILI